MKVNTWTILLMSAHLTACAVPGTEKYQTSMDSVTAVKNKPDYPVGCHSL